MLEIDPKDENQKKENDVKKIIDGRHTDFYELTKEGADHLAGKDAAGKQRSHGPHEKVGKEHEAHPDIVAKFVKAGWAKKTRDGNREKMPKADGVK